MNQIDFQFTFRVNHTDGSKSIGFNILSFPLAFSYDEPDFVSFSDAFHTKFSLFTIGILCIEFIGTTVFSLCPDPKIPPFVITIKSVIMDDHIDGIICCKC